MTATCTRCNQQRPLDPAGYCQTCARKIAGLCAYTPCDRPHRPKDRYCDGHRHQMRRHGTLGPLRGRGPQRAGKTWTRAEMVEEVEHLIGTDSPASIATRLGYTSLEGLYRALQRAATTHPQAAHLKARMVAQSEAEADLLRHISDCCWQRSAA